MGRLIFERIILYAVIFVFFFVVGSKMANNYDKVEKSFLNELESTMTKYSYVNTTCNACDILEYSKGDDKVKFEYIVYENQVKVKTMSAYINMNYYDNLSDKYLFLEETSKENVSVYNEQINTLINEYKLTGEEQMYQDLKEDRQITLEVKNSTSSNKDYMLYYNFNVFK